MKTIPVSIADLNVAKAPDSLITYALGSCVGICLYDPAEKVVGLAHILLPDSKQIPDYVSPMKFADMAIPLLVGKMQTQGARLERMQAKIAGGAQMFAAMNNVAIAHIGLRNVAAVKQMLEQLNIPIVGEDTGKDYGRTLLVDAETFTMTIRSPKRPELQV